eukprot:6207645-Pleurochrysis_carterae.AAC.3
MIGSGKSHLRLTSLLAIKVRAAQLAWCVSELQQGGQVRQRLYNMHHFAQNGPAALGRQGRVIVTILQEHSRAMT